MNLESNRLYGHSFTVAMNSHGPLYQTGCAQGSYICHFSVLLWDLFYIPKQLILLQFDFCMELFDNFASCLQLSTLILDFSLSDGLISWGAFRWFKAQSLFLKWLWWQKSKYICFWYVLTFLSRYGQIFSISLCLALFVAEIFSWQYMFIVYHHATHRILFVQVLPHIGAEISQQLNTN